MGKICPSWTHCKQVHCPFCSSTVFQLKGALRNTLTQGTTQKDAEKALSKWFTGAGDRGGYWAVRAQKELEKQQAAQDIVPVYLMAYKCCHAVKFTRVKDTGFYFKDDGTADVEEDRFAVSKSHLSVLRSTIQDKDGAILVLDSELRLEGRRMNIVEEFDNEFNIKFYVDDNRSQKGRPVILYAVKEGKNMLVCCNDNHEVHPVVKDLPEEISEDMDKAVFYMTDLTTSMFMFESSYFPSKFLAFEHDESNSVKKLVLLHKEKGKVIESAQLYLQSLTE